MVETKTTFDYVGEIWSIADWVRDVIRPADYNKLILPFALLRAHSNPLVTPFARRSNCTSVNGGWRMKPTAHSRASRFTT